MKRAHPSTTKREPIDPDSAITKTESQGVPWQRILIPAEHGTWAFLAEPVVLGLLVASSWAGVLIAVAALSAFLARQPLKLMAGDRRRGKRYPRTRAAERGFALLTIAAAAALASAVLVARSPFLFALALAAPFAGFAVAFDLNQRSRELLAELAAPFALSSIAAAIALADGWSTGHALGLWGILAARALPSIFYVRARLRLERGEPSPNAVALVAQIAGIAGAAWLAARGLTPGLALGAIVLLALRAAHGLSRWRFRMTTMQLGFGELAFGLITVLSVAVGVWRSAL